jgi:hypothetical protein
MNKSKRGCSAQILGNSRVQEFYQIGVHKLKVVGDIKTDDPLSIEKRFVLRLKLLAVGFFHHENDIRPLNLLGRQLHFCVMIEARRIGLHIWPCREHLFSGWASKLVLAANKEGVRHKLPVVR